MTNRYKTVFLNLIFSELCTSMYLCIIKFRWVIEPDFKFWFSNLVQIEPFSNKLIHFYGKNCHRETVRMDFSLLEFGIGFE